jgi:hypothetical protein
LGNVFDLQVVNPREVAVHERRVKLEVPVQPEMRLARINA